MRETAILTYPVSDNKVKSFPVAVLFNWLCSVSSCVIVLVLLCSPCTFSLFSSRFEFEFEWHDSALLFIGWIQLLHPSSRDTQFKAWNNGSRKTFAGVLHSSAFCNLGRIKGETLQSHLFNHTLPRSAAATRKLNFYCCSLWRARPR